MSAKARNGKVPTRPPGAQSSRSRSRKSRASARRNTVTAVDPEPARQSAEEVAKEQRQIARWSAMCIQRCFRGYLARTKLLPHFRYLRTVLDNVDVSQVFALYLGWQRKQDDDIGAQARRERWLRASARLRKLVVDSERLDKTPVRGGSTALGAFGSGRDEMVWTTRPEYQFDLLAKYISLDVKGTFNFQGLVKSTGIQRLRAAAHDGLAFPAGLNEGTWMVFARDCRLWPTSVTHRFLRALFRKYAVVHRREGVRLVAIRCYRQHCDARGRLHKQEYVLHSCAHNVAAARASNIVALAFNAAGHMCSKAAESAPRSW